MDHRGVGRVALCLAGVWLSAAPALAQQAEGHVSATFSVGRYIMRGLVAGGDALLTPRLAVGGEAGVMGGEGNGFIHLGGNARYRLAAPARRNLVPFASAGYSYLYYFYGATHAMHLGGGVDVGVGSRRAVRIEVRNMFRPGNFDPNFWVVRFGLITRPSNYTRTSAPATKR